MADTDYYTYSIVKDELELSTNQYNDDLDRYGATATADTDNFFAAHTTTPFTGAAITDDVKRRTRLLVMEWFDTKRHRYKSAEMFNKQRLELEARMITGFKAEPSAAHTGTAYARLYRTSPLKERSELA